MKPRTYALTDDQIGKMKAIAENPLAVGGGPEFVRRLYEKIDHDDGTITLFPNERVKRAFYIEEHGNGGYEDALGRQNKYSGDDRWHPVEEQEV